MRRSRKLLSKKMPSLADRVEESIGFNEGTECLEKACSAEISGVSELFDALSSRAEAEKKRRELETVATKALSSESVQVSMNFVLFGKPKTAEELMAYVRDESPHLLDDTSEDEILKACQEVAGRSGVCEQDQYNIYSIPVPVEVAAEFARTLLQHVPAPDNKHVADQLRALADSLEPAGFGG